MSNTIGVAATLAISAGATGLPSGCTFTAPASRTVDVCSIASCLGRLGGADHATVAETEDLGGGATSGDTLTVPVSRIVGVCGIASSLGLAAQITR
eukprot:5341359-Pyramimonas_sp.AAC.1